jgi:dTDP-4-dehydrorhamnose reductase
MNNTAGELHNQIDSSAMNVLVLGATGMVGRSWIDLLSRNEIEYTALARPQFDLANPELISKAFGGSNSYSLVVNAAAWTDVDAAESDQHGAMRANAHALGEIAEYCKRVDSTLISYSTDYVFSGNTNTPYETDSPHEPINFYGKSKALGEQLLIDSGARHLLIRTSWVYAPWGSNFVSTILKLAEERSELRVVDDQRGRPTSAQQLAASSYNLLCKGVEGTWHLTDSGECTWYDFATEIVRYAELDCKIHPCTTAEFPRPTTRPSYSTLDISASLEKLGTIPHWKDQLHLVIDKLNSLSDLETQ